MQTEESVTSDGAGQIEDKRYQVKQAGERIREHARKCARSCYLMGKELVAIRPMVDELYPDRWIKWSRKYTQGLSRATVWRWMKIAESYPTEDIDNETRLIDLYRALGLAKKKSVAEPDKPDTTLVSPAVTVTPVEAPTEGDTGTDEKNDHNEIGGHGGEDDPLDADEQDEEDVIEDEDDEQEEGDEDTDQDEEEEENEQGVILGEALDLVHQMEKLLQDSTLLHTHIEPLKCLLIRLSADAELLV